MANDPLNPTTRQKLRELARRRRSLLLARGAFAGVLTLLAAMALVATADRLIVLDQAVRIVMSLAAYLLVVAVVYRVSLRYLLRFPSDARLAQLIESAEPSLREDLVSAVELADSKAAVYDSSAFREVLQRNVARKVERVDTDGVLPWKMVAWWAGVSLGAMAITAALMLTPGLRYTDLLTRALLPTADLDRVSDVRITLISPELGDDGKVPMNADLPIEVEITGGEFDDVVVDVVASTGDRVKLDMRSSSEAVDRFTTDIAVGDRPLKFRIRAGDGVTRYFELDPTARPSVQRFSQIVTPPDYTRQEPQRVSGTDGEINALAGAMVDLTLTANQPIQSAKLVLELPEGDRSVPLYVDTGDATLLTTSMPIEQSGTYRIELVALETGFINEDARRYEITARPDALPKVDLHSPEGVIAEPSDALVKLLGRASDDVGLDEVVSAIRVNSGEWSSQPVAIDGRGAVVSPMDLMPLNLSVGDEVELRLSATDLAGNTAHSASAKIIVTPDGFELAGIQALRDIDVLIEAMTDAAALSQEAADSYREAMSVGGSNQSIQRRQALTRALSASLRLEEALARADRSGNIALSSARPGTEAERVMLASRAIAQAQMHTAADPFDGESRDTIELSRLAVDRAKGELRTATLRLTVYRTALQSSITQQQARMLALDLARVAERADRDQRIDADLAEQRLRRRLNLSAAQSAWLQDELETLADRPETGTYRDRYQQSSARMKKTLANHPEQIEAAEDIGSLVQHARQLQGHLIEVDKRVWHSWVYLTDRDRDEQNRHGKSISLDADMFDVLRQRMKDEQGIDVVANALIDRLRRRAELEELRPNPDNSFVVLTDMASRSLMEIRRSGKAPEDQAEAIEATQKAYRTIERVQSLVQVRSMVLALAKSERLETSKPLFALDHRLNWSLIEPRLEAVEKQLNREPGLKEAAKRTLEARRSTEAQAVHRAFHARRDANRGPDPVNEELEAIARMLAEALKAAEPALAEARKNLSEQTPDLPERLRDLAQQAEQLAERSEQAAEQAENQAEQQVVEQAEQLAKEQERINTQLESLAEQLRREANEQDLFTEEGREAARDFDDAIAMIKPDAEEATEQLELAQRQTTREHERPDAIEAASEAQQATADTLNQLAEHFENLEQGSPLAEQTREALREQEAELGIQEQLEQQFERMEKLAELAELSDAERLAQLEQQLEKDRVMQRELDKIADDLAGQAQQRLEEAAQQEGAIAEELDRAAAQVEKAIDPTEKAIDELAQQAQQLEQEEVRPLAHDAQRNAPEAKPEIEQAQEALKQAAAQSEADAQQAQQRGAAEEQAARAQELAEAAREAADQLEQAAQDAAQAAQAADQAQQQAVQQADQAGREGSPEAPQAAREAVEAQERAEQANAVKQQAQQAAREAEQLAKNAEKLNEQVQNRNTEQADAVQEQGAAEQAELAEEAQQAAEELARAARHEERLGEAQRAEQLAQASQDTEQLAEQTLPETADAIGEQGLEQGEEAARTAEDALNEQAQAIEQAQQAQGGESQGDQQTGGEQSGEQQAQGEQAQGEQAQGDPPGESQGEGQQSGEGQQAGEGQQVGQGEQSGEGQQAGQSEPSGEGQQAGQGEQSSEGQQASQGEGQGSGEPELGPLPQAVAEQLARELDRLDEQLNGDAALSDPNQGQQSGEGQQAGQGEQAGEGQSAGQQAQGQGQGEGQGESAQGQGQGQGQGESQSQAQGQGEGQGQSQSQGQGQGQAQGQGQGQSGQPGAGQRPIDAAAQAQAQAIRDARMPGGPASPAGPGQPSLAQGQPGQQDGGGDGLSGNNAGSNFDPNALAETERRDDGRRDWGDLPERMVEDLNRGQRERAPSEYLDQVDAYFRAIAKRAREQNNDE